MKIPINSHESRLEMQQILDIIFPLAESRVIAAFLLLLI